MGAMPQLQDYDIEYEYEVPDCYGGTFKLDIALLKDGKVKVALLVKAINSNFAKNLNNYLNTTTGEAMRCGLSPINISEIIFVTVAPRVAPRFKANGNVDGFDEVERIKSSRTHSEVFGLLKAHVWALDFFYDIDNVKSLTHKDQFQTITISDLQTI